DCAASVLWWCAGALLAELLEAAHIELVGSETNDVAGGDCGDQPGMVAERLAEPRHARLERCRCGLGRLTRPELVDQPLRRDHLVRVQRQQGEQAALPRSGQGKA